MSMSNTNMESKETTWGGSDMADRAVDSLDMLKDTATECLEQGRAKAQELAASLEAQIRAQPLAAVAIAAGVGLLLGAVWSRR